MSQHTTPTREGGRIRPLGLIRPPSLVPYGQALRLQLDLRARLADEARAPSDRFGGFVIALQHPPVITLGKRGQRGDVTAPRSLVEGGGELFQIDRGGEATCHEPGQLVIYPILSIGKMKVGVVDLVRGLAGCLSDVLRDDYGVEAHYDTDHPGLWVGHSPHAAKIASVGMRVSRGITTHGAAINLANTLEGFGWIVPCGMPGVAMTRLEDLAPEGTPRGAALIDAFTDAFLARFSRFLDRSIVEAPEITLPAREAWIEGAAIDLGVP